MKSGLCMIAVLLFVGAIAAQPTSAAPAKGGHDATQQTASAPGQEMPRMNCPAAAGNAQMPACGFVGKENSFGPGCRDHFMGPCGDRAMMWRDHGMKMMGHHVRVLKAIAALLFFGLLACGTVNVLLTILVSIDMTRSGHFNGLWIPILLLAGIPGTIIYALFRMGDNVRTTMAKG